MTLHKHMYYFDPQVVNLKALQKEAVKASTFDKFGDPPRNVTIHHHRYTDSCVGNKHEDYKAQETK